MRKNFRKRPGPKSMTESKIITGRGTLGESSCNDDDSDSPDDTANGEQDQIPASSRISMAEAVNASEFRTPERVNDITDYGLEFTTSHIRHSEPRRCSTMRQAGSSQEEQQIAGDSRAKPLKKPNPRQSKKIGLEQPHTSLAATTGRDVTVRRPRKQRNPVQLEKRFWKEVHRLQCSAQNMIPMLPFSRLVRELLQSNTMEVTKITKAAMETLQTASEMYMTQILQDAYMLTLHRGRVTLEVKDLELIKFFNMKI